jgi:hypothetical protein
MLRTLKFAGLQLALVAMVLRALLPDGWMPAETGASGIPIAICTVNGPLNMVVGQDGKPSKPAPLQNSTHHPDACPFAAAPHFATIAPAVAPAPSTLAAILAFRVPQTASIAGAPRHTPQSPRAPPSFV